MPYFKYFKSGQKIYLRALSPPLEPGRFEALTVYFQDGQKSFFNLTLPYRAEAGETYPFTPGMPFELLSEAFGLGLRLTCTFAGQQGPNLIRVAIEEDLQIFQRRDRPRLDLAVGLRYTKGRGTLRSFRQQWEKNLDILAKTTDPAKLPPFPRVPVNLSSGGIRLRIRPPIEIADLCLLLLQLQPGESPLCTLAEVVWTAEKEEKGRFTAGMRFLSILEADQKRIDTFLKRVIAGEIAAGSGQAPAQDQE